MAKQQFTASKSRSSRPGWTITFRHPLKLDSQRRPGRKVRRGLGTTDADVAEGMVEQMNQLLADSNWWHPARRREAATRFDPAIVDAFYDDLLPPAGSTLATREAAIPMPGKDEGYARVLFVGTTGAGKTTLLRQLIGSHPDEDRFPSTAPAKTTIADIEVILADGPYEAAVTFFPEVQIQGLVEECVVDAALAAHNGSPRSRVAERLLNHRDQRFRLSYVLGPYREDGLEDFSFDDEADDQDASVDTMVEEELPPREREENERVVAGFVERATALAGAIADRVAETVRLGTETLSDNDRDALAELIEEAFELELHDTEEFTELVQDVMDAIRSRFEPVVDGLVQSAAGEWPASWRMETEDRTEFIRAIRWFSSNFWPHFGRLLTPVVDGMRIRGPLYPPNRPAGTRLVLIDGQGLGHTPDYNASISTNITSRFESVDVILLVDNAQQPMQTAPLSLLRTAASTGHHDKLAIAFTHFDMIKGPNLATAQDRRAHVMASVVSAMSRLRDAVGVEVARSVEHGLDARCFMLGGTDRPLTALNRKAALYMRAQLEDLVGLCERSAIDRDGTGTANVEYDALGMLFAVQDAVQRFQKPWRARLGLATYANVRPEHWTRVKALSKRIGTGSSVEYDTLQPLADLHRHVQEAISLFLDNPLPSSEEGAGAEAIAQIRRTVSSGLIKTLQRRLIDEQTIAWFDAYAKESGIGSTRRRSERISRILEDAAPVPQAIMTSASRRFVDEVVKIVASSVETAGGRMLSAGRS